MKILFTIWKDIYHPDAHETEEILWNYARELGARGHDVYILSSAFEGCTFEEIIEDVHIRRIVNIHTLYFKIGRHYSEYYKHKFDIIINECGGAPILLPHYERETPLLLFMRYKDDTQWDQEFKYPLSKIGRFFHNRIHSLYNEHLVLTPCGKTKQQLITENGFKEDRVFIIENDLVTTENQKKKKESLLLFLKGGKMEDIDMGLKTFKKIHEIYPSYTLTLSINPNNVEFQNKIKKHLATLVTESMLGYISFLDDEKREDISNHKFALISSQSQDYSEEILEASSYATPCIGFHNPHSINYLKHIINGIRTSPGDLEELIRSSKEIIEKPENYKNLVQKSFGFFEQQKKYYKNTNTLESILQKIIQE